MGPSGLRLCRRSVNSGPPGRYSAASATVAKRAESSITERPRRGSHGPRVAAHRALGPVRGAAQPRAGAGRGVFGTTFVPKAAQPAPRRRWAASGTPPATAGARFRHHASAPPGVAVGRRRNSGRASSRSASGRPSAPTTARPEPARRPSAAGFVASGGRSAARASPSAGRSARPRRCRAFRRSPPAGCGGGASRGSAGPAPHRGATKAMEAPACRIPMVRLAMARTLLQLGCAGVAVA